MTNRKQTSAVKKTTKKAVIKKIATPTILPPNPTSPPETNEEFVVSVETVSPVKEKTSPLLKTKGPIEITEAHRSLFNKMVSSGLLDNLTEEDIDALALATGSQGEDDEAQKAIGDLFVVDTKDFNGLLVKEVHLPKFLKGGPRVEEKGNLYLTFVGEPEIYEQLLKLVVGNKMNPLTVAVCVPTKKAGEMKVASKIVFPQPIFMAIDFGNLARTREEPRELKIEIDFSTIKVNDTEFQF